jgi:2-polyprenyl-3-methyl-5-hydroxy-6-metoxy-1,4-benzoquinol methylase
MALATELSPDDPAFDITDRAAMNALLKAEEQHFWHRARNHYIRQRLHGLGIASRGRILELGCGAGCVAGELSQAGYDVTGVDGHRSLIDIATKRAPHARFLCRDLRQGLPDLAGEIFDAACMFDVIEHLHDPEKALEEALAWVAPNGHLVGTVPALMALWSGTDAYAGHKTRYSARTLRAVLERVRGAKLIEIAPFFRSLVPIMWIQRRFVGKRGDAAGSVQNLSVPRWPLNGALFAMVTVENRLATVLDKSPVPGASLWFALRRSCDLREA